jgi:hypothetical protein
MTMGLRPPGGGALHARLDIRREGVEGTGEGTEIIGDPLPKEPMVVAFLFFLRSWSLL